MDYIDARSEGSRNVCAFLETTKLSLDSDGAVYFKLGILEAVLNKAIYLKPVLKSTFHPDFNLLYLTGNQ